ncbi:hypothetical protein GCM10007384_07640 [Aquimarina muelleri]|uniref:Uncharacterized protein n=1 Tax=Aquimarina muelleri TaxID=279356 RepID=A0A918N359_9FLAO|nr:hypothetical protein GCM10007384_07640 [Aquimarina muelleri]
MILCLLDFFSWTYSDFSNNQEKNNIKTVSKERIGRGYMNLLAIKEVSRVDEGMKNNTDSFCSHSYKAIKLHPLMSLWSNLPKISKLLSL